jgi:hypothetical protein
MEELTKRFAALENFLGCYFHEDWDLVTNWQGNTPNFEEVVRFFKSNNIKCPERVERVINEMNELLALADEDTLEKFADSSSVAVYMPAYGLTYRQWFEGLLRVLEEQGNTTYLRWS